MTVPKHIISTISDKQITAFRKKFKEGDPSECWAWLGTKNDKNYGMFAVLPFRVRAHRIAYFLHYRTDPKDLFVLHKCPGGGNPTCVNPHHLSIGTHIENMIDMIEQGRAAAGDRNPARLYPERLRRGDNHPAKLHPERLARGVRHGRRTHPESFNKKKRG